MPKFCAIVPSLTGQSMANRKKDTEKIRIRKAAAFFKGISRRA
jgi:hypothetical protein